MARFQAKHDYPPIPEERNSRAADFEFSENAVYIGDAAAKTRFCEFGELNVPCNSHISHPRFPQPKQLLRNIDYFTRFRKICSKTNYFVLFDESF